MNKKIERIETLLEDYGFTNKDYTISLPGPTLLFARSGQIKLKKIKVCRLIFPACLDRVGSHRYIFSNVNNADIFRFNFPCTTQSQYENNYYIHPNVPHLNISKNNTPIPIPKYPKLETKEYNNPAFDLPLITNIVM